MDANLPHRTQMRNGNKSPRARFLALSGMAASVAMCLITAGCAPKSSAADPAPPTQQAVLDAGFAALEAQPYNDALNKADEVLNGTPHGAASAEALYLKGRALEGKNASGELKADEVKQNLQAARAAYIRQPIRFRSSRWIPTSAQAWPTSPIFRTTIPPRSASGMPRTKSSIATI